MKRHKFRNGFKRKQTTKVITLSTTVSKRLAKIVETEAAIADLSVSAFLAALLHNRYHKVLAKHLFPKA